METYEFMKSMGERANRVDQIYAAWAKRHGVNYNMLAVLYTTYKNDQCSQKFVCEEWCLPKQTVNTTCRDLIASGIITQVQSTEDKREIRISLTPKGRQFAAPIVTELLEIENRVLMRMGKDDVMRFFNLYHAYVESIELEFAHSNSKD